MLEQRVAALEAAMREVKGILGRIEKKLDQFDDRLRRVEIELAEVKGRISQLPTTWAMVTFGSGLAVTVAGFIVAVLRYFPH